MEKPSMYGLVRFDVSDHFGSFAGKFTAEVAFGLSCAIVSIALRGLIDVFAPGAGPFAIVYPTVLLATLYGHLAGGLTAYVFSFFYAWMFVLEPAGSFAFAIPDDAARVFVNAAAALIIVIFSEAFRHAVRRAIRQRDQEIEFGHMLLAELEHRTKNNLALVVSLLEYQRRRSSSDELNQSLGEAVGRIRTFADAYSSLSLQRTRNSIVRTQAYLQNLISKLNHSILHDKIEVTHSITDFDLPGEIAVAIGLYVNEAITNIGKYAFAHGETGQVNVTLQGSFDDWRLDVSDNGSGKSNKTVAGSGLGSQLMEAFAVQANASHSVHISPDGRQLILKSKSPLASFIGFSG